MTDDPRPQPDPRLIALARETANRPTRKQLAWEELKNGIDVRWLSLKYQIPLADLERAKLVHESRERAKQEKQ